MGKVHEGQMPCEVEWGGGKGGRQSTVYQGYREPGQGLCNAGRRQGVVEGGGRVEGKNGRQRHRQEGREGKVPERRRWGKQGKAGIGNPIN